MTEDQKNAIRLKIQRADEATGRACEQVDEIAALAGFFSGRVVNGFGVFSDPSMRKADLWKMRDAINAAIEVMSETDWPTREDYKIVDP